MTKTCTLLLLTVVVVVATTAVNAGNNDDINRDDFVEKLAEPAKDFVTKVVDAGVPELMDSVKAPGFIKKPIANLAKSKAKDFAGNQIDKFVDAHDSDEQRLAAQTTNDENKSRNKRSLDQLDNQHMMHVSNESRLPGMRRKKTAATVDAYLNKGLEVLANSAGVVSAKLSNFRNNRRNNAAAYNHNQYAHQQAIIAPQTSSASNLHASSNQMLEAQLYPQQTHLTGVSQSSGNNYAAFSNNSPQHSQYNAIPMQQQQSFAGYGGVGATAYSNVNQQY